MLPEFFILYMAVWGLASLLALYLMARYRGSLELFRPPYWRFLFQDWKVLSFLIAATGLIVIAPYTGDPTWDYVDAFFMSVLAFTTAPWAVGTLYLSACRRVSWAHTYIAICIWLFSASWSYDLYLVIRDGAYPNTWLANMFASSVLYVSAGLLWSLDWREDQGVVFGFTRPNWPERGSAFDRIFWFAVPLMLLTTMMIVSFLM